MATPAAQRTPTSLRLGSVAPTRRLEQCDTTAARCPVTPNPVTMAAPPLSSAIGSSANKHLASAFTREEERSGIHERSVLPGRDDSVTSSRVA